MGALGSIDAALLLPVLESMKGIVGGIFATVSAAINLGVTGSAGSSGLIQSGLGSIAGT